MSVFRILAAHGVVCALVAITFATRLGQTVVAQSATESNSVELSSAAMSRRVDELLDRRLAELDWEPAPAAEDAAFLRRAYLDLAGEPPSGREVLDFCESTSLDKRAALIDRLLKSPQTARHFSDTWSGWMLPDEDTNNPFAAQNDGLQNWLRERFADNLRYDRLVADLLVSTGQADSGPAGFFVALEGRPEKIAARTARVFMGVQLDCAECHDHPFDDWTQRDFWGFAAYFAQLSTSPEQAMTGRGEVNDTGEGEVMLPDTDEIVLPKPLVETGFSGLSAGTRRQQLTLWLTARENPFLARATVNRVWALLFGQGLIEPIDDMRSLDIASHPELLGELSEYFAATGYDLRNLVATLAKTQAYQRSTQHPRGTPPPDSFAVMATKPLTQLQMAASIAHAARQVSGDSSTALQARLRQQLGKLRGDASEAKLGIVNALVTLNGQSVDGISREESSRLLKALEAPFMNDTKRLRWLFLSTLSRLPTAAEETTFLAVIEQATERRAAAEENAPEPAENAADDSAATLAEAAKLNRQWQSDLLWALLNTSEFAMTP